MKIRFAALVVVCALAVLLMVGPLAAAAYSVFGNTAGLALVEFVVFYAFHLGVALTVSAWVGLRRARLFWTAALGATVAEVLGIGIFLATPGLLHWLATLPEALGIAISSAEVGLPLFWGALIVFVIWCVASVSRHAEQALPADGGSGTLTSR